MGDRSPKEKMKKKQQHDKELKEKESAKIEKLNKNRHQQPGDQSAPDYKKVG